jgi:hypothetical protein
MYCLYTLSLSLLHTKAHSTYILSLILTHTISTKHCLHLSPTHQHTHTLPLWHTHSDHLHITLSSVYLHHSLSPIQTHYILLLSLSLKLTHTIYLSYLLLSRTLTPIFHHTNTLTILKSPKHLTKGQFHYFQFCLYDLPIANGTARFKKCKQLFE